MKTKRIITAVISIAFVIFLLLCCYSGPVKGNPVYAPINGPLKISFEGGSFPADSESLSFPIKSSELELLDYFTSLKSVDFSGADCYDEIDAWAKAHPEIELTYSLSFPNGVKADINAEHLELIGLDESMAEESAGLLSHTRNLKTIDLGSAAPGNSLSGQVLSEIQAAVPDAKLSYSLELFGDIVSLDTESLDYSSLSGEDVDTLCAALSCMSHLKSLNLGGEDTNNLSYDEIARIEDACPEAVVSYKFNFMGQSLNTADDALNFSHVEMNDQGAAVREILPMMKNCKVLDMDFCGVSNENMAKIREDFPDIKVIWRIWFGENYSVRTDVERILASKPSKGGVIDDSQIGVLKYCTDLKYLDVGHNECITDLSFLSGTPNMEVMVLAMNPISDISPLANCPKLEYIELNSTLVSDLSPLSELKNLRHLNLGNCPNVSDISPLYGLTELERLWLGCTDPVPEEQVKIMQEKAPECEIDAETTDPTQGGWRFAGLTDRGWKTWEEYGYFLFDNHPRYDLLREQFKYGDGLAAYSFYWNDPLY